MAALEQPLRFSFKVPDEDFEEISSRQDFKPAPYLARAKWVLVTDPYGLNANEWKQLIKTSYELVRNKLTKKARIDLKID